jgi:hypothetical protein
LRQGFYRPRPLRHYSTPVSSPRKESLGKAGRCWTFSNAGIFAHQKARRISRESACATRPIPSASNLDYLSGDVDEQVDDINLLGLRILRRRPRQKPRVIGHSKTKTFRRIRASPFVSSGIKRQTPAGVFTLQAFV